MALTNIEVVSVPVTDQDAAKSFYVDKLGFSVEMDNAFAGGSMRWVMLRPPGSGTAITLVTWFETMPAGSLRGAVLGCDDLEKTLADLAGRGRHVQRGRHPGGALGPLEDASPTPTATAGSCSRTTRPSTPPTPSPSLLPAADWRRAVSGRSGGRR